MSDNQDDNIIENPEIPEVPEDNSFDNDINIPPQNHKNINEYRRYAKSISKMQKLENEMDKYELAQEMKAMIQIFYKVVSRMTNSNDMNLRCYTLLDKFMMMMDIVIGSIDIIGKDIDQNESNILKSQLEAIQLEIGNVMTWVIRDRDICTNVTEMTHPI